VTGRRALPCILLYAALECDPHKVPLLGCVRREFLQKACSNGVRTKNRDFWNSGVWFRVMVMKVPLWRPGVSCLSSPSIPLFALNLPCRLAAAADAPSGMVRGYD
jgi:hypothetical protein